MKQNIFIIFMILVFVLNCPVYAQNKSIDEINREMRIKGAAEKADKIKALLKNSEVDIIFYGKVLDQYNQSVSAAKINGNLTQSSIIPPYFEKFKVISAITDSNGNFSFTKLFGLSIYIETIEKEGYAFKREGQKISFDYSGLQEKNKFLPDPNTPIVFILHKKPEPGYVEEKHGSESMYLTGGEFEIDLIKGVSDYVKKINSASGVMIVSITPGVDKHRFNIVAATCKDSDFLIEQDVGSHIAPESGAYKHAIEFELKREEKISKNFYFKGLRDNGYTYARINLQFEIRSSRISCIVKIYSSLENGRNFEYDERYTYKRKIQDISNQIDHDPTKAQLYSDRAELKRHIFEEESALEDVMQALKLAPNDNKIMKQKEKLEDILEVNKLNRPKLKY